MSPHARKASPPPHGAGFTLLELLIGAALIAVVASVVAGAFAAGFRVWQRAVRPGDGEAVLALELITKDLRNTVPFRLEPFKGKAGGVDIPSLVTTALPDGTATVLPGMVGYEFNSSARTLDRVTRSFPFPDPERIRRETVLESVEAVRFAYGEAGTEGGNGVAWGPDWQGRTNTPVAVKVELEFITGGTRLERERIILLPCR